MDDEIAAPDAVDARDDTGTWKRWIVAPQSWFEVHASHGRVGLQQIDPSNFLVTEPFRFSDPSVVAELVANLTRHGKSHEEARRAVDDARTFTPSENPTDMASIPRYMRWFENTYGTHTLAAIIHDELIVEAPNGGALGSDTLSDRFFRQMMKSAHVPWLKRWIMWAAVALRSRFAAGGWRRLFILLWIVLAVTGIAAFVNAVGSWLFGWGRPLDPQLLVIYAAALPIVSAPLWGRQGGASLIAAVAALWIMPAAALAWFGFLIYSLLEFGTRRLGVK